MDGRPKSTFYAPTDPPLFSFCVGNVVARGTERAPDALAISSDNRCLAFVGPSEYIVTIMAARSLDEVLLVLLRSTKCLPPVIVSIN